MNRGKYKSKTNKEKADIILEFNSLPVKPTLACFAKKHGIPISTLATYISKSEQILSNPSNKCRATPCKYPEIEKRVLEDLNQLPYYPSPLGTWIKTRAEQVASELSITSFKATNRWAARFKRRSNLSKHNLSYKKESETSPKIENASDSSQQILMVSSNFSDLAADSDFLNSPNMSVDDNQTTDINNSVNDHQYYEIVELESNHGHQTRNDNTDNENDEIVSHVEAIEACRKLIVHCNSFPSIGNARIHSMLLNYLNETIREYSKVYLKAALHTQM